VLKPVGMLFIFLSMSFFGFHLSFSLSRRVEALDYFVLAVEVIRGELRFLQPSLPRLFEKLASDPRFARPPFFALVAKGLSYRKNVREAWREALAAQARDLCLSDADTVILLRFAYALGGSDLAGQDSLCAFTLEELKSQRDKAAEYRHTHAKTYRILGVLSGLFVCLLLV